MTLQRKSAFAFVFINLGVRCQKT